MSLNEPVEERGSRYGLSRRAALFGAAAVAPAWMAFGQSLAPADQQSEAFLDALFEVDAEYLGEGETRTLTKTQRAQIKAAIAAGIITGAWAASRQHPDYAHLGEEGTHRPFDLTHDALAAYLRHNHQTHLLASAGPIIFGLRGCRHLGEAPLREVRSIQLVEASPNHTDLRCVVGIWWPARRSFITYSGSTVPNLLHMQGFIENDMRHGASLLCTGVHGYAVGTHRRSTSGVPGELVLGQQPGALLLTRRAPVLRLRGEMQPLCYSLANPKVTWDLVAPPSHNIHAGNGDSPLNFSSAGCQVIAGGYDGKTPTGMWRAFRRSLGLSEDFVPRPKGGWMAPHEEEGRRYEYLLLTGRDAQIFANLAARGDEVMEPARARLRFGSRGPAVRALGEALNRLPGAPKPSLSGDEFDVPMFGRWIKRQSMADGIVGPAAARVLGVDLTPQG